MRVILIGRGTDCDLVLDDDAVSRRHAELRLEPGGWTIVDLQSSNGTFVTRNGHEARYERLAVTAFDTLRFGTVKTTLPEIFRQVGILKDEPEPQSAPSSAPAPEPSPQPAPQASADTGGRRRTVRCQCGAPKKEGSPCPVCGA
ncbi:MAG: FHA domain-containing protein [Bryobacterales bacterium]